MELSLKDGLSRDDAMEKLHFLPVKMNIAGG